MSSILKNIFKLEENFAYFLQCKQDIYISSVV